ncbi:MAG: hypothetical protein WC867_04225 [Candidatus Pacearchaeota archaeon]|jgi:hypothetical protein
MKRPIVSYLIIILILFVSFGALFGGFSLIKDPTGNELKIPSNYLEDSFFNNYFYPGLILFFIIGIFPLFLVYGLIDKKSLKFLNFLKFYSDFSWQLNFLIYYSLALIIWIDVQIIFVPYFFLQPVISLIGVIILFLSLFPSIREYYK